MIVVRAITYAVLFIGLVLIYVPARLLSGTGIVPPDSIGLQQVAAVVIGTIGMVVALWCVFTFTSRGRGTPAPFDPPRKLVVQGPYRYVRNPMYLGAGIALAAAALYYGSVRLLGYAALFFLITHIFVVLYEEPNLRQTFGHNYEAYCNQADRWLPKVRPSKESVDA